MRKMYERKYPRREGEALWRYNRRISKKMAHDRAEIITGGIAGVLLVAFMFACLVFGGDDQCTYVAGDNGVQHYKCLTHGYDCPEND